MKPKSIIIIYECPINNKKIEYKLHPFNFLLIPGEEKVVAEINCRCGNIHDIDIITGLDLGTYGS